MTSFSKSTVFKLFSIHAKTQKISPVRKAFSKSFVFRDGLMWTLGVTLAIKVRFRDGLVWTLGLTVEIKLRFIDGLVWTVGLTVEIKLRFIDGLLWTVGQTVEIKLRFQICPT